LKEETANPVLEQKAYSSWTCEARTLVENTAQAERAHNIESGKQSQPLDHRQIKG
jgi:hypothetical protein